MSYRIYQRGSIFEIAAGNVSAAFAAVKGLASPESLAAFGRNGRLLGLDAPKLLSATNLEEALGAWSHSFDSDDDGNLVALFLDGDRFGDYEILYRTLAPFVKSGCYLGFEGEDGSIWRYWFDGSEMREEQGTLAFGSPDSLPKQGGSIPERRRLGTREVEDRILQVVREIQEAYPSRTVTVKRLFRPPPARSRPKYFAEAADKGRNVSY